MKVELITFMKFLACTAGGWAVSFLMPISHFIGLAIALTIADFITGVWAAKKRGDKITSTGYRRTISKTTLYLLAVVLAHAVEKVFFSTHAAIPVTYIVACFLCLTEFKSALENIGDITGANVWSALRSHLEKFLNSNSNKDDSKKHQ
jgi:phage-related holin